MRFMILWTTIYVEKPDTTRHRNRSKRCDSTLAWRCFAPAKTASNRWVNLRNYVIFWCIRKYSSLCLLLIKIFLSSQDRKLMKRMLMKSRIPNQVMGSTMDFSTTSMCRMDVELCNRFLISLEEPEAHQDEDRYLQCFPFHRLTTGAREW